MVAFAFVDDSDIIDGATDVIMHSEAIIVLFQVALDWWWWNSLNYYFNGLPYCQQSMFLFLFLIKFVNDMSGNMPGNIHGNSTILDRHGEWVPPKPYYLHVAIAISKKAILMLLLLFVADTDVMDGATDM